MGIDNVGIYGAAGGVGMFTLSLLKFAYGAIRDAMAEKDELIEELRRENRRLRNEE